MIKVYGKKFTNFIGDTFHIFETNNVIIYNNDIKNTCNNFFYISYNGFYNGLWNNLRLFFYLENLDQKKNNKFINDFCFSDENFTLSFSFFGNIYENFKKNNMNYNFSIKFNKENEYNIVKEILEKEDLVIVPDNIIS